MCNKITGGNDVRPRFGTSHVGDFKMPRTVFGIVILLYAHHHYSDACTLW